MKFYSLKYVTKLGDGFGGEARMWRIRILNKYRGDEGLLQHEIFHVLEWYAWGALALIIAVTGWQLTGSPLFAVFAGWAPWAFKTAYRWKWYRTYSEAWAYRIQLAAGGMGGVPYHSPQFAINALMHKYGLGLSERRARELLKLPPL